VHVLWVSDSPDTPSGFGMVTRFVCRGLARGGHDVRVLGWQSTELTEHDGFPVYPIRRFRFGSDALYSYLLERRPDAVVILGDIWWLPWIVPPWLRRHMSTTQTRLVQYFPIDGARADGRLPPSWTALLAHVDVAVAMSRYGQRTAQNCGIEAQYIPHGVDAKIFQPPGNISEAKRRVGVKDRFVVLSDSRNQPRKMLPRLLDVFSAFAAKRPDALLHVHTDPYDAQQKGNSYDLFADVSYHKLSRQVRVTNGFRMKRGRGLSLPELAALYQAADVHLLASTGEGFGLPNLQAAATGTIPLAGAHSACRELVEGHGQAIAIADWIEDEFGIRRGLIDVANAAEMLANYYDDAERLRRDSIRSRAFALSYQWERAIEEWDALLRSLPDRSLDPHRLGYRTQAKVSLRVRNLAGVSASATVRLFDHADALLKADITPGREVSLPASPPPSLVHGRSMPRRPGLIGVSEGAAREFLALKKIFPILAAWSPTPMTDCSDVRRWLGQLAQSVMLMNLAPDLPDDVLVAAAVLAVPCVGTRQSALQAALWPDLTVDRRWDAVRRGRELLSNGSLQERMIRNAERVCEQLVALRRRREFIVFRDDQKGLTDDSEGVEHVSAQRD
jgi:glycosyltransferase involved in cell wall biosynthesis